MRKLCEEKTANYPRIKTDCMFADYSNCYDYKGIIDETFRYIEKVQLLDVGLWKRFVRQYEENADSDRGWRGEYWGKMMRGACFTYSYTQNEELYELLVLTVKDMLDLHKKMGRLSSYPVENELAGWDIWSRKYVLLGMQYFIEICKDDSLKDEVIDCMRSQVDDIMSKIGPVSEGKKPITAASNNWRGMNSSSILEPVVRLYSLTNEKKYLDFATHIVGIGGADISNLFELAYKNQFYPYQYPVTKAYEMISCFEGLLEYYRVTGIEKHKISVINFADKVLESDFTIIGTCGCSYEMFDHSTVRQANTTNVVMKQETCVTVTMMKFMYQLTLLTGDAKYADAFEISLYNAYLGSVNTEKKIDSEISSKHSDWEIEPLPFDSYSPLTAGMRGVRVGGLRHMSDNHYYGCCACIGSAGIGLVPKMALMTTEDGFVFNLYTCGSTVSKSPDNNLVTFRTNTEYPKDGNVKICVELTKEESFEIRLRNPAWSKTTKVTVCGKEMSVKDGYIVIKRKWKNGDSICLEFDMRTEIIRPVAYGHEILMIDDMGNYLVPYYDVEDPLAKNHIALRRGPIILAQDSRLGYDVCDAVDIAATEDEYAEVCLPEKDEVTYRHIVEADVVLSSGEKMKVTDYASAGKLWSEESKMAAWMLVK